ncbi:hypothetical protein GXM21_12715 (plasmid) [Megamonas funiformis]|uniref:Lipocalin-like domain-containing protein n=1 Tax=Megamonas funiformis YIT 11815 TaxID=742816 RepID=A0ABN0EF49_9FIRM|nr:hypothetical protein [Megamonas funiformis]EHR31895.1 hypothetical protein HMPREF9454_02458 [Megamonas funiformis YIT 11815]QIB61283.1 hypothetical protein GXM21_12715 [Megamonas funiformis]
MKAWKTLCIMSLLLLTMVLAGCSNEGDKYIGKWTGLENPDNPRSYIYQMTIEQNGDNYIIKRKVSNYNEFNPDRQLEWQEGKEKTESATLKDGKLVSGNDIASVSYTYIEKDNTLLYSAKGIYLQKDDDNAIFENLKKQAADALTKYWEEHPIINKTPIIDDPFIKYGKAKQ